MLDSIVFIKRQSPDWAALSADHRAGRPIDPRRYVPDHDIPTFPDNIEALIEAWNRRFRIDFFTVRHIIAQLCEQNIRAVRGANSFGYKDVDAIQQLARRQNFIAFFHDDDDFFAPDLLDSLRPTDAIEHDVCVFPLYRAHADLVTFVRADMDPPFIWGRRVPFLVRFHTNNYGLGSHICSEANLLAMKDHMLASAFADAGDFRERVFSFAVSATVKTPASASQLRSLLRDPPVFLGLFRGFISRVAATPLPADHAWLSEPIAVIVRLLAAVLASG